MKPDLVIEQWPLSNLLRYANNSRDHSEAQIAQISASIAEFGFVNPCLIDAKGVLIAGHGRVSGAQKLGMESVPVIRLGHLTETQARALRISDNAIALNSTWNLPALKIELEALKLADYPMELVGFDNMELVQFMAGVPAGKDPEATPEPPATPVSKRGDIWVLGQHRVMCGDATNAEDVERLLDGAKPHLCVSDPPYGVDYDPDWRNRADRANGKPYGARAIGLVINDDVADWSAAWKLFPGDVIYQWHPPGATQVDHYAALVAAGFEIRMQIIWAKQQFPIGRGNYHVQHEPCYYGVRKGKTAHWSGDRSQTTLWSIDKPHKSETGHSTQKPIECMKRPIENNSQPGDAVYDPFMGSGTTTIAAEITGRKAFGLEIDPGYCDIIVQRWQDLTNKEARHEDTGLTHDEERDARAKPARKRKRERTAAA